MKPKMGKGKKRKMMKKNYPEQFQEVFLHLTRETYPCVNKQTCFAIQPCVSIRTLAFISVDSVHTVSMNARGTCTIVDVCNKQFFVRILAI